MTTIRTPKEVYDFWFVRCGRELWFRATPELDVEIREGFRDTHLALAADVGAEWRADAESRLAAVIVLDQFPRNIYRGTALAVATDGLALREAKLALASGADLLVEAACRTFSTCPSNMPKALANRSDRWNCSPRLAMKNISIMRSAIAT